MTRDHIQGFIDGYNKAGGKNLTVDMQDWMSNHPQYPLTKELQSVVLDDISSYRGAVSVAPVPVQPAPVVTP